MTRVGVHQAKTRFSELLRSVESGEEVVITRGGRPVARIVSLADGDPPPDRFGLLKGKITDPNDWEPDDEAADLFGIPRW